MGCDEATDQAVAFPGPGGDPRRQAAGRQGGRAAAAAAQHGLVEVDKQRCALRLELTQLHGKIEDQQQPSSR
eukprot:Skav234762  [mRNA]  locus=scaffold4095:40664:44134:- [translate_table: standard]